MTGLVPSPTWAAKDANENGAENGAIVLQLQGLAFVSLDARGRLALPTKHRDDLVKPADGRMVITMDLFDPCLLIYPETQWLEVARQVRRLGNLKPSHRRLQRRLIGPATDVTLDRNGRIQIPQGLRDYAKLEKQVVVQGQGNKLEVWDKDAWDEENKVWHGRRDEMRKEVEEIQDLRL